MFYFAFIKQTLKTKIMEQAIKEVQKYFINKILSGEFEITKKGECTFTVLVDGKYSFCIWMANQPQNRRLYEGELNFIWVEFTQKQRLKLHSVLRKHYNEYMKNTVMQNKMAELERLKKELNIK
jgi:uncharacterized protein YaiE (UPF0345 family)